KTCDTALDGFAFGGDVAASLSINIEHIRLILLGFTALITADIVANAGAIRFIGLVIQHP
uniref:iron chelate uptake ABC transporter family permease subunit n=1 Tax=Corynebacterium durum TaxID=61592 RepID=UPI0028EE3E68